ncbi:hypothetical protein ANANG_G00208170 [Anguilla anguilla]|uniref:Uncharacterized protein n=1 Tax=Anguilla anguilla TaxID=7936 RepID=A0A9D3RRQ7_ANGAN|nr:hypothetical protein ANANG_G00208170 [Anguilla anguilla]
MRSLESPRACGLGQRGGRRTCLKGSWRSFSVPSLSHPAAVTLIAALQIWSGDSAPTVRNAGSGAQAPPPSLGRLGRPDRRRRAGRAESPAEICTRRRLMGRVRARRSSTWP